MLVTVFTWVSQVNLQINLNNREAVLAINSICLMEPKKSVELDLMDGVFEHTTQKLNLMISYLNANLALQLLNLNLILRMKY